jgi:hypothetical protein
MSDLSDLNDLQVPHWAYAVMAKFLDDLTPQNALGIFIAFCSIIAGLVIGGVFLGLKRGHTAMLFVLLAIVSAAVGMLKAYRTDWDLNILTGVGLFVGLIVIVLYLRSETRS